ncbi:zinc ribbon domain-containing protein [candidate division KSB1 bacterium]|nr:zinc ribbon domain-containing protein [candidate division KSB1 bacterium]
MPIYEFKCQQCDVVFDELVNSSFKIDDIKCPHCNGSEITRKMSAFGFSSGTTSSYASSCGSCSSKNCSSCH